MSESVEREFRGIKFTETVFQLWSPGSGRGAVLWECGPDAAAMVEQFDPQNPEGPERARRRIERLVLHILGPDVPKA